MITDRMFGFSSRYLFEQSEAVHLRHVDVREHHVDPRVIVQFLESLHAVVREDELVQTIPDAAP